MKPSLDNARLPQGEGGKETLQRMNESHAPLAAWGFSHISPAEDADAVDLGCGGGANLEVLLAFCPKGKITGLDYSPVSVEMSLERNRAAVEAGRCQVIQGDVSALPFEENSFDMATAFENRIFLAFHRGCLCPGSPDSEARRVVPDLQRSRRHRQRRGALGQGNPDSQSLQ